MRTALTVIGIFALLLVYGWMAERDSLALANDAVTDCRPPGDEGEKLVATLIKSHDGGPLTIHCTYHATLSFAP